MIILDFYLSVITIHVNRIYLINGIYLINCKGVIRNIVNNKAIYVVFWVLKTIYQSLNYENNIAILKYIKLISMRILYIETFSNIII